MSKFTKKYCFAKIKNVILIATLVWFDIFTLNKKTAVLAKRCSQAFFVRQRIRALYWFRYNLPHRNAAALCPAAFLPLLCILIKLK
jgi:hypothetical protein